MKLKGSKTEKNLLAAFAGESQARNRYTFYATAASKEGFEGVAGIFLETAVRCWCRSSPRRSSTAAPIPSAFS